MAESGSTIDDTSAQTITGTGTYSRTDTGPGETPDRARNLPLYFDGNDDDLSGELSQSMTGRPLRPDGDVQRRGQHEFGETPGNMNFSPFGRTFVDSRFFRGYVQLCHVWQGWDGSEDHRRPVTSSSYSPPPVQPPPPPPPAPSPPPAPPPSAATSTVAGAAAAVSAAAAAAAPPSPTRPQVRRRRPRPRRTLIPVLRRAEKPLQRPRPRHPVHRRAGGANYPVGESSSGPGSKGYGFWGGYADNPNATGFLLYDLCNLGFDGNGGRVPTAADGGPRSISAQTHLRSSTILGQRSATRCRGA